MCYTLNIKFGPFGDHLQGMRHENVRYRPTATGCSGYGTGSELVSDPRADVRPSPRAVAAEEYPAGDCREVAPPGLSGSAGAAAQVVTTIFPAIY